MNIFWTGKVDELGVKLYDLQSYQYALAIVPLCAFVGGVIIALVNFLGKKKL